MRCDECKFWEYHGNYLPVRGDLPPKDVRDDGLIQGDCRVAPPTIHPAIGRARALDASGDPDCTAASLSEACWPVTYHTDWCGEFKPNDGIEL
jgi:hypothetical protein